MKKLLHLFTILGILFIITGCVRNTDVVNVTKEGLSDNTLNNINYEMVDETSKPNKTVVMKTNKGDITIELFNETMPITANNFLRLAQEDFYDGLIFHRVIAGFMIQGGDPKGNGSGDPGYSIPDEFTVNNKNNKGTLSMANSGPNSGGSQFFINLEDNNYLDDRHPVFGRVVSGMEVVEAIGKVKTSGNDKPVKDVVIEDIVVQP